MISDYEETKIHIEKLDNLDGQFSSMFTERITSIVEL